MTADDVAAARAHVRAALASLVAASVALGEVVTVAGTSTGPTAPDAPTGPQDGPGPGRRPKAGAAAACGKCGSKSWQRLGNIRGGAEEVVCGFCGSSQE